MSFNTKFLGSNYEISHPILNESLSNVSLNSGEIFDFTHFSLAMNKEMRSAIYVASNIDKSKLVKINENRRYHFDEDRIGRENQLGDEFYKNHGNGYDYDRGHLARRADLLWGSKAEAEAAQFDSCCYANISLQHPKFHEVPWSTLENWIFNKTSEDILSKKLSIFAGPFYEDYSIVNNDLSDLKSYIPAGFWKTIFYIDENQDLKCLSFIMYQNQYLPKGNLEGLIKLKPYQVSLNKISEYTGLEFEDSLYNADVFNSKEVKSDFNLIENAKDLIF